MKKVLKFAVVASIGAMALAGCSAADSSAGGSSAGANSKTPKDLVNAGQVTLCIDPEYPPLEYYADGSGGDIIGFDADAGRALADYWGVKIKYEVTSFDGLMPGLQSRRCDMILGGLYTSAARLQVADAAPIMNAGPAALAAPGLVGDLKTKLDLCGRKVVAQAASSNAASVTALGDECKKAGKAAPTLSEYPKTSDTVLAVLNGKADVLVETNVAAAYMVTQNKGRLEVANKVFDPDTTFGVFSKKGGALSPAIATAFKAMHDDGTLAKIATKYNLDPTILDVK
ncbi:transporter substrate-binding domain-containing protein [Paenarthrobacter sp. PH39-S1]|uniref:transporter substrate-binding domain-containing protein n=1 Tax=Paenarthrobacter sp. PH39-S1 TaxID=3046204 RepID=UPI0024B91EF6|nr:transporter substrate-binding domain-containing protein [Paenarthrobacter sp. PH39-S1]MDJ0357931.1 transporter substrate-binding domain-containing protein [Paenarthrobacter sp. PH39-S1]